MPAGYRSAITRRLQLESLEPRWAPATITVTTLDAGSVVDGEVSLREAFHAANDNISVDGSVSGSPGVDIIEFAPGLTGVIQLQGVLQAEEPLLVVGNGRTSTILDGTSVPQASMIRTVSNAYLSISQMTLRDGDGLAQDGGAIRASSELYLVDVRITNSRAGNGGAISSTDRVWIENSTIEDNESNIRGGAIYTTGSVFIKDSIIRGNTGFEFGGAIYASGDIDIENSIIEDNSVIGRGGAIFSNAKITVEASEVSGNSATELGRSDLFRGIRARVGRNLREQSGEPWRRDFRHRQQHRHFSPRRQTPHRRQYPIGKYGSLCGWRHRFRCRTSHHLAINAVRQYRWPRRRGDLCNQSDRRLPSRRPINSVGKIAVAMAAPSSRSTWRLISPP